MTTTTTQQLIRVGHSPDPDDAFMFYALANDKIHTGNLRFAHELQDIETLNRRALNGELEVTAVSIHAYSFLLDKYALLPSGCSMGDNYGPMVVARRRMTIERPARPEDRRPGHADDRVPHAETALRVAARDESARLRGGAVRPDHSARSRPGSTTRGSSSTRASSRSRTRGCTSSSISASGGRTRPGCRCRWAATWSARTSANRR